MHELQFGHFGFFFTIDDYNAVFQAGNVGDFNMIFQPVKGFILMVFVEPLFF